MASGTVRTPPEYGNNMHSPESVSPSVVQAQEAFLGDLVELLKKYRGQWVAYLGRERIEVGRTQEDVYQRCLDRGHSEEDFIVLCVEPDACATTVLCHLPLPERLTNR